MKAEYITILVLYLISQIGSLANLKYDTIHINAEHVKVCPLEDGRLLVLSSLLGYQKARFSFIDKNARIIKEKKALELDEGYTAGAELVQTTSDDETEYHLIRHNKQDLSEHESKEYITSFKDGANGKRNHKIKNSLFTQTSVVSLKNGTLIIAGINHKASFGAETSVEVNIYDPKTDTYGNGKTIVAHSSYISCYEQRDNEVYCVYVSYEDIFLSKLNIRRLIINDNTIELGEPQNIIKVFYTEFNFIKAVKFNENEALVLFQTGNGNSEIEFGNTGKDLYYYHIEVKPETSSECKTGTVKALRYEYLYNNCIYRKDPEDYNADIIALSDKRVYAVCEHEKNRFIGFEIFPDKKAIQRFNFNNFDANEVRNPVFSKFDKNLALFFTHINNSGNHKTAYMLINYPDCEDINGLIIPQHHTESLDKEITVVMANSHPASRQNEKIKVRFVKIPAVTIKNSKTDEVIELNKDLDPSSVRLRISPNGVVGNYTIEFTATREDRYDGVVLGRTCKIEIETPECLPQCDTCPQLGTEEHNYCLSCKNESYTPILDNGIGPIRGYSPLYNCRGCNVSCSSCYGLFYETPAPPTTNCKVCNYKDNYFPYEDDERTCISQATKKYWESVFGRAIFLDKSGGEEKENWIWRKCHENCAECEEAGDEEDNKCIYCITGLYFFCNQTVGNGIPGSCHSGCIGHGFYKNIDEGREKCCPCLLHCEKCQNETKCDKCYKPFYRTPDAEHCDEDCGYCLAKDDDKRECVNCKTDYPVEKYNLDGRCVDTVPNFTYTYYKNNNVSLLVNKSYHIEDEKCNLLDACKEGCARCSERFSDKCTKCEENYYRKDPFGIEPKPTVFECYSKDTCKGIVQYPHNPERRIGGVPITEDDEKVCLNCRQRNESFRLPEDRFYCGPKIDMTYVDIDEYNKLSECYFRCKSCDTFGNAQTMNCLSCRDSANYDIIYINARKGYGNCYRKAHKCGIYPYYHDYDLAPLVGKTEDDCGEACDVCLYNFSCTERFPFFVYETHECVEYCPFTEVLGNKCNINNTAASIILFRNPLGLKNPYDFLNNYITINEFISSSFVEYIAKAYNLDMESVKKQINNHLGSGQIYNLPESQIIVGNNITIELTSFKLELAKLAELFGGIPPKDGGSILDLSSCEAILKKKYGISDEEDLMIIKGDLLKQLSEEYLGTAIEYQVFSTSLGAFLPLSDCQQAGTTVTVTNPFDYSSLLGEYQSKIAPAVGSGYNVFDVNSPFYNDICTPFTNENGNDVLLDDRRKDYFNENLNLCEKGCVFSGYDASTNYYTCLCNIKIIPGEGSGQYTGDYVTKEMPEDFKNFESKRSNIEVFKCASQVFSASGQKKNFGSYILLVGLASFIGVAVFHFIKEKTLMDELFRSLGIMQSEKANPPKPTGTKEEKTKNESKSESKDKKDKKEKPDKKVRIENKGKTSKAVLSKPRKNPTDIHKEVVLKDDQLNFASYTQAVKNDNRTFIGQYWSLLKMKQLCIFTFYTSEDYILRSTKIALFILFMCFYFAFTALFFNDSIMRAIYTYKGNTKAAIHIPNIVLSSLCSIIMCLIVRFVSLNERDIVKITQEENPEERKALAEQIRRTSKIKTIILYIIAGLLIGLCWYYVAAFCAVFKNSQGHYFINLLVAFIICNAWPFVTSLISAFLRKKSLETGTSDTLYKISQIISII